MTKKENNNNNNKNNSRRCFYIYAFIYNIYHLLENDNEKCMQWYLIGIIVIIIVISSSSTKVRIIMFIRVIINCSDQEGNEWTCDCY